MAWQTYGNRSGKSPIDAFDVTGDPAEGEDAEILIRFKASKRKPGRVYRYFGDVAQVLIELARAGHGLASYIAREQPAYASRS
jgi:hypothetical protein